MKRDRSAEDITGQVAASDALGDEFLFLVLSMVDDKRERALLFAHIALDLSLAYLARTMGQERKAVEAIVAGLIDRLQEDEDLRSRFADVQRAGRPEHFIELAAKLGLQDWSCAYCGRFIVQPSVGRPRITCSEICRKRRNRGNQQPALGANSPHQRLRQVPADEGEVSEKLRVIIKSARSTMNDDNKTRNSAIVLLGFNRSIQMSPKTLASIQMNDVKETAKGLEVFSSWDDERGGRYVWIPYNQHQPICPVRAVMKWKLLLRRCGLSSGPLFQELPSNAQRNRSASLAFRVSSISTTIFRALDSSDLVPDPGRRGRRTPHNHELLLDYLGRWLKST